MFFLSFLVLKCNNQKKTRVCFVFWRFMVGENHQKPKKQVTPKKQSFEAKPNSFFKVLVFWFLVLRFWGYCHSLHMTSFQIYQDNEQGLYYLCVCVSWRIWYKRLWGGSQGGGYHICIYIWVNYNISLTWIKAIWGWFPLLTMISSEVAVRSL